MKIGKKSLLEWGQLLATKNLKAFPVEHTGTLFKLYALYAYLIFPYLPIIKGWRNQNNNYRKFLYLDLFAGNGLNEIKDGSARHYLCGSAIIALLASHLLSKKTESYFDQMIMVDNDTSSAATLLQRLGFIITELDLSTKYSTSDTFSFKKNVMVLKGDVTESTFIAELEEHLQKLLGHFSIHIMFFIDPPTPESLRASTLNTMLSFPGDVILLLHTGIFAELVNKKRYTKSKLQDMLGISEAEVDELYSRTHKPEDLQNYYVDRYKDLISKIEIQKVQSGSNVRDIIKTVEIKTKSAHYVLLYATRRTGGANYESWQDGFEQFAKRIGELSETGDLALQILLGKQDRLSRFL